MSSGMDPAGQASRGPSDEGGIPVPTFRPPPVQQQQRPAPGPSQQTRPAPQGERSLSRSLHVIGRLDSALSQTSQTQDIPEMDVCNALYHAFPYLLPVLKHPPTILPVLKYPPQGLFHHLVDQ